MTGEEEDEGEGGRDGDGKALGCGGERQVGRGCTAVNNDNPSFHFSSTFFHYFPSFLFFFLH